MPRRLGTLKATALAQFGTFWHGVGDWCKRKRAKHEPCSWYGNVNKAHANRVNVMAATWTNEETIKLVELWGKEEIQALLEGCARNKHVYDRIA